MSGTFEGSDVVKGVETPRRSSALAVSIASLRIDGYMPVPVRPTPCGLAASGVALIAIDADSVVTALGLKVTPTRQ